MVQGIDIDKLKLGDEKAWKELFRCHYAVMCYVASQYLKDNHLAEAVASDVLSHMWEIKHELVITTSLRSYLLQATKHKCLDYLKSRYTNNHIFLSEKDAQELKKQYAQIESTPVSKIFEYELESKLDEAVDLLPEETRTVFVKSRYEGLKYDDIATAIGISKNTVKYHIKKALAFLRSYLDVFLNSE